MSSLTQTTAFVLRGDYTEESRKIPVLAFFEQAHKQFDAGDYTGYEEMYTEDFSWHSPHGEHQTHDTAGYHENHTFTREAQRFFHNPLTEQEQIADEIIVLEGQDGRVDMVWLGTFYANVQGSAGADEQKVKSPSGKEWDVSVPVAWQFDIVKDSSARYGYKVAKGRIFKDMVAIYELLDQRQHGHLKPKGK